MPPGLGKWLFICREISQLGVQTRPGAGRIDGRRLARRIAVGQVAVTLASVLAWLAFAGPGAAGAALAGGLIALLPGLYFALRLFARDPGSSPQDMVKALYRGEAVKFFLTAMLFVLAIRWFAEWFPALIGTFALALAVQWVAPFELEPRRFTKQK